VLGKNLRQPVFHPYGRDEASDRPDVWYVAPDGQDLDRVVDHGVTALKGQGLPFINRYAAPVRAFRSLLSERGTASGFSRAGVMMPGNPGSPAGASVALAVGHLILADPRPDIRAAPVLQCESRMYPKPADAGSEHGSPLRGRSDPIADSACARRHLRRGDSDADQVN
jgi:hypothetical protein